MLWHSAESVTLFNLFQIQSLSISTKALWSQVQVTKLFFYQPMFAQIKQGAPTDPYENVESVPGSSREIMHGVHSQMQKSVKLILYDVNQQLFY